MENDILCQDKSHFKIWMNEKKGGMFAQKLFDRNVSPNPALSGRRASLFNPDFAVGFGQ